MWFFMDRVKKNICFPVIYLSRFSVENRRNHHSACQDHNVFTKNGLPRDNLGSLIYSLEVVNFSAKHAN